MHYTYRGTTNERGDRKKGEAVGSKWVVNAKGAFHRPGGRGGVGRIQTGTSG